MTINKFTLKVLGTKYTVYRVLVKDGEVLQVLDSHEEADAYIKGL